MAFVLANRKTMAHPLVTRAGMEMRMETEIVKVTMKAQTTDRPERADEWYQVRCWSKSVQRDNSIYCRRRRS